MATVQLVESAAECATSMATVERPLVRLVICADDAGYSQGRTTGIIEGLKANCVSSTSLLANAPWSEQAARMLAAQGWCVGLHLNLTEFSPLSGRSAKTLCTSTDSLCFRGKHGFRKALSSGQIDLAEVAAEAEAQVEWFVRSIGRQPSHIDGHQHIHVIAPVAEVVAGLCAKYRVGFTRLPIAIQQPPTPFLSVVSHQARLSRAIYQAKGVHATDYFLGLCLMGRQLSVQAILASLDKCLTSVQSLAPVSVELMTHPGHSSSTGDEFDCSGDRPYELSVLCDPALAEGLRQRRIVLSKFLTLQASPNLKTPL